VDINGLHRFSGWFFASSSFGLGLQPKTKGKQFLTLPKGKAKIADEEM